MFAADMVWIAGQVKGRAGGAICESRNAPCDKAVNVERDGSDCNCSVAAWKLSGGVSIGGIITLTCSCLA